MIPGNVFVSTGSQIPPLSTTRDTSTGLPSSLDYLADISAHHGRAESDLDAMINDPQYFGWNEATPDQVSHQTGLAFDPGPKDMLQMWLEPRPDSKLNGSLDLMHDSHFPLMGDDLTLTPERDRHSVDRDSIPNERFARVQQCWLAPPNTGRLINTLWRDIAMSTVDNLFSVHSSHLPSEPSVIQGSRCGFDEDCRQRLQAAFGLIAVSAHIQSPMNRIIVPAVPSSALNHSGFPPAEIFDMALDLFFRLFNPLLPFVHQPTFSAKNARPSLLYVMTLVGMTLLGTKGTTAFVSRNFPGTLEKVTAEFARCSMGVDSASGTMTLFATALLLINLAGLTGEKVHLEQCQPLYINVMSVAQRHGLFSATEGQSLDMTLFETVPDIDMRWKAWSKVESTKRIIIGLLLLDSWYSSFLSTGPIAVPDSIQVILPCSESLFCAHSSIQWTHLIRSGKRLLSSTVLAPSENINIPALESPADDFCIQAVLAIVQLRQSESYHRLLSNRASYPFAPCHTYAMDGRARCLPSPQSQLITNYGETLDRLAPNALITWHNMCMTLTADIQIFDLAAGRAGPAPARKALDDIREWSQTPAARRACLHAAHIYKVMTNRKASDQTTFQSIFSLFSAGLVLGLYTFTASESTSSPSVGSVELMDDVDWRSVGTEGFTSFMEPGGSQTFASTDPAVNFIRNGATVYLRGLPFHGGYQSARRILLDYASLLKDAGKWSVKQFSYILYIMSDVLMDVE
ncbi:Transcription factor [Penicillium cf. griseofulvum]|nr:Transcription factor [Penicillium cf. griseofulvum]